MTKEQEENELYQTLVECTSKDSPLYDAAFDKEIRRLRPDWFKCALCDADDVNCDFIYEGDLLLCPKCLQAKNT